MEYKDYLPSKEELERVELMKQAIERKYSRGRPIWADLLIAKELLQDNLTAWEGEEESVKTEHADLIQTTRDFLEGAKP